MTERAHNGLSYRQGIDAVVRLLGGTGTSWVPAVLAALAVGRLRSSELLDAINQTEAKWRHTSHSRPLSPKVFRDTTRRMERDGLPLQPHFLLSVTNEPAGPRFGVSASTTNPSSRGR